MIGKKKFYPRDQLRKIVAGLQKKGVKVVFTNGCFDLLHVGHVRCLKKSRSYGDVLVVALNSDSSIIRFKSKDRPIVPLKKRVEVMSAIEYVDYVTVFDEETPEKTLRVIMPDILVKGADYKFTEIVGHDFIPKTVRFPIVKGESTSDLIKKIISIEKK
jgi:D-beta-D-heptose 7-phosphate kinase/D-beta-D-heptose 1-phosphate adenosyltransferase